MVKSQDDMGMDGFRVGVRHLQNRSHKVSADWPKPGMHNTYSVVKTGEGETWACPEEDAESPQDEP